ncbi:response regulator [Oscillatoria sp. FACHB-1406]|uniref:response regulator n=1 Tax=Oscillatoria sp. FACHB-1406 TaxID=2692846 RepID=UPI0016895737|nr:response regulator [Oscillatoria sp. FACHB-1406]
MNYTDNKNERVNILIVDDTPANLKLLANVLKEEGYKIRASPNGKIALEGIKISPPDLILLDIMMPEMNGYEVCEKLRLEERYRDIPIIFISALNEVFDKVKAFELGAADYITKPFQAEEVLSRVRTHLEKRFLQQSYEQKNRELTETLESLKMAQAQLVQSEKMVSLGQLIAGIAHEINTPLGAIQASASNSTKALKESASQLPALFEKLSNRQQREFFELVEQALNSRVFLSSEETRSLRRALTQQLQDSGIEEARDVADTLLDMGICDRIEPYLPLLQSPEADWILQLAYNLVRLQSSNKTILSAVERASKVVFALKTYAYQNPSGEKQSVRVADGIETVLELYRNQLKHKIEVERAYQPLPSIMVYPDELNQVWTNLLHNAIYAMNGEGRIAIAVDRIGNEAIVKFTDSGCGIAPHLQQKIFEPFFTTKPLGEGSGLGLDIVRKIIEKHEGKIQVKSQPGCTTFTIALPLKFASEPSSSDSLPRSEN